MEGIEAEEVNFFGAEVIVVVLDEGRDDVYTVVGDGRVLLAYAAADVEVAAAYIGDGGDVVRPYVVGDEVDVLGAGLVIRA